MCEENQEKSRLKNICEQNILKRVISNYVSVNVIVLIYST